VPFELVDGQVARFRDDGFLVRPLVRRLVLSRVFAEASGDPDSDLEVEGLRRATPWHLARDMEDLTGVRWTTEVNTGFGFGRIGQVPLMKDVTFGFKTLAGGPDGYDTWEPAHTATPATLLTLRALAGLSAPALAASELAAPPAERRLLQGVEQLADPSLVALAEAQFLLFGVRPEVDSAEVAALRGVFDAAGGPGAPEQGWTAVFYALLQHPRMLFY